MEFRCSIRPAYTAELPPFSAESGTLAHRLAGRNFRGKGRVGSDQPGVSCGACGRAESTQLHTLSAFSRRMLRDAHELIHDGRAKLKYTWRIPVPAAASASWQTCTGPAQGAFR